MSDGAGGVDMNLEAWHPSFTHLPLEEVPAVHSNISGVDGKVVGAGR